MSKIHILFDTPRDQIDSTNDKIVLLVGTADDGPTNAICKIRNKDELTRIYNNSSMSDIYESIPYTSYVDVYGVRINGSPAYVDLEAGGVPGLLSIYSFNSGAKYNNKLVARVDGYNVVLQNKLDNTAYSYSIGKYITIGKLCEAINTDCKYGVHNFIAADKGLSLNYIAEIDKGIYTLSNGYDYEYIDESILNEIDSTHISFNTDIQYCDKTKNCISYTGVSSIYSITDNSGLVITLRVAPQDGDVLVIKDGAIDSNNEYIPSYRFEYQNGWHECKNIKQLLLDTYNEHIYNIKAKAIVVTCVEYGDSINYVSDLANYCYSLNAVGYTATGIMGAYKKGTQSIDDYVNQLVNTRMNESYVVDGQDIGAYIHVIAGQAVGDNTIPLTGMLGGLVAYYNNNINITNKVLSDGLELLYDFKEYSVRNQNYLDRLTNANITCPYISVGRGICVYTSVTFAVNAFKNSKFTRIGQEIVNRIIGIASNDIGDRITAISVSTLNNKVTDELDSMVGDYLQEYTFTIEQNDLYEITINVEFVPVGDIESLSVKVVI